MEHCLILGQLKRYSLLVLLTISFASFAKPVQPIIDVHIHGFPGIVNSGYYLANEFNKDQKYVEFTQEEFKKHNIVLSLVGVGTRQLGDLWLKANDPRFIIGPMFPCYDKLDPVMYNCEEFPDLVELEKRIKSGQYGQLGELLYVYYGIPPTDERLKPYWELANKYGLPVGVHADSGPPRKKRRKGCCPNFNGDYGNPLLLAPILEQYPNLKIYLMHFGRRSLVDEGIELMKKFPNVYCENSAISLYEPIRKWEPQLKRLFEEGLGDRLLFASDYGGRIERAIDNIHRLTWLTESQKQDVFYNNAARMLGLTEEQKQKHFKMVNP